MIRLALGFVLTAIVIISVSAQPVLMDVQGSIQLLTDADIHGADKIIGHNDLRFYGDGTGGPDLFIRPSGNVGVGTTNPFMDFTIRQKTTPVFAFDGTITNPAGLEIENINEFDSLKGGLLFADHLGSLHFAFDQSSSSSFTQKSHIRFDNGDYHSTSDRRLKTGIRDIEPVLDRLLKLKPSTYILIGDVDGNEDIGFIAQEVEDLFPEVVSSMDGLKSICYAKFSVLAIKALQEQQEEMQKLLLELKAIESNLNQIDSAN